MADSSQETGVTSSAASRDKAFEIFVKRTVSSIQKEANGRGKDIAVLRDACQSFLDSLEEQGCSEDVLLAVLSPLQLACSSGNPKIVDLALGCLHKLVAHAWLSGESSNTGNVDLLEERTDSVEKVIRMVIKCGDSSNEALQLGVVRALLTFTTAEHFVAHGDVLLAAVRTVFNLALGAEQTAIKRTACTALLQMLNTITKRVSQLQPRLTATNSEVSRMPSDMSDLVKSMSSSVAVAGGGSGGTAGTTGNNTPRPLTPSGGGPSYSLGSSAFGGLQPAASSPASEAEEAAAAARTAQLASLAEQRDIRGLEAALEATGPAADDDEPSRSDAGDRRLSMDASAGGTGGEAVGSLSTASSMASRRVGAAAVSSNGQKLSTAEKDVLLVLTAFCKLASREAGAGAAESFLHQGKLLALELLVKVLQNPLHSWDHVRDGFTRQLRQPLCMVLLRNCAASDPPCFSLAGQLLMAILVQPRLRQGLRAELGAFYPLLLLKPLEAEQPDWTILQAVLLCFKQLCADAQLVVDLFVNYDCDLQASNLYERTVQVLSQLVQRTQSVDPRDPTDKRGEAAARLATAQQLSVRCILQIVNALDAWAGPIRDSAARAAADAEAAAAASSTADSGSFAMPGSSSTGNLTAAAATAGDPRSSEAERFAEAKTQKSSLVKGIAMFNSNPLKGVNSLIITGVVEDTAQSVASFIRKNAGQLDKAQIGELFGHHEDFQIACMHAFVDQENYTGITIDQALRNFLEQFRLPGEAQKIDRIMEKFAERFCKDNPGLFRSADAAYMLSFAIIMLNTDAHNPMAERRLGRADFVAMNYVQVDEGDLQPALPVDELEAIYSRIVANEIVVRDDSKTARDASGGSGAKSNANARLKLAMALGWNNFALPFRMLAGWDKAKVADTERRQILDMAQLHLSREGGLGSNAWHTATHAEHARPMLEVSGGSIRDALSLCFSLPGPAVAEPLLAGLVQVIRLAGLLGLDELCEDCVALLGNSSGVFAPAGYGSEEEAKQLVALRALCGLGVGPRAGLLGSSWPILLRTISELEALQTQLTRPPPAVQQAAAAAAAHAEDAATTSLNPFSRMLKTLGLPMGGGSSSTARTSQNTFIQPLARLADLVTPSSSSAPKPDSPPPPGSPPAIREAPGASLVMWAETEGAPLLERVYAGSAALDGDGVVVFVRALCAVSQEELEASPPRLYSLQKLVEAAYANISRIRFIWARLWGVISAHLVGASCHVDSRVAMYAVDSLRQLVAKLLARAELANFTHQEDALRPFVAVLRQCDDTSVRELAVQCITQAITAHARGLGSGWRMVLEALRLGGADTSGAVVAQSLEALQVVVQALYRGPGIGHECLRECVRAIMAGVNNRHHPQLSAGAVQLLQQCGARLAEHAPVAAVAPVAAPREAGSTARDASAQGEAVPSPSSPAPSSGWALILETLSSIVLYDSRPGVTAAATQVTFELLHTTSRCWDAAAWDVMLTKLMGHLFLPPNHLPDANELSDGEASATRLARMERYFPELSDLLSTMTGQHRAALLQQLTHISLYWYQHPSEPLAAAGLRAFVKLAVGLVPRLDASSTKAMLDQLAAVVHMEVRFVVQSSHLAAPSGGGATAAMQPASSAAAKGARYRVRCRMLGAMQRAIDQIHAQCVAQLGWHAQAQLLAIATAIVDAAMEFNQAVAAGAIPVAAATATSSQNTPPRQPATPPAGGGRSTAAGRSKLSVQGTSAVASTSATASALASSSQPSSTPRSSASGTPSHARANGNGVGNTSMPRSPFADYEPPVSFTTGRPKLQPSKLQPRDDSPPVTPVSADGEVDNIHESDDDVVEVTAATVGEQLPELVTSSSEHTEVVRPALMRLEVEGGMLLIDALVRSMEHAPAAVAETPRGSLKPTAAGVGSPAAAGAEQQLLHLCRRILACAANSAGGGDGSSTSAASSSSPSAAAAANITPPHSSSSSSSAVPSASPPQSWEHAVRAPLVVKALQTYQQVHHGSLRDEIRAVFPQLMRLMCCGQLMVRQALYNLLAAGDFASLVREGAAAQAATATQRAAAAAASASGSAAKAAGVEELNLIDLS